MMLFFKGLVVNMKNMKRMQSVNICILPLF